jgi:hypothetical protein
MAKHPAAYLSYLLRLWHTGEADRWKASLEDPVTGYRRGFGSLQALFGFLLSKMQEDNKKHTRGAVHR